MRRRTGSAVAVIAATVAVAVSGCGSSSVSALQLRTGAQRACAAAALRLGRIQAPQQPGGGEAFVSQGIAALAPELTALKRLSPTPQLAASYRRARSATEQVLSALRSTLKGLKAGNDPVVAIKTLQQELLPLEGRAQAAWHAVGVPACAGT
ncbi:MAG TPA: hypothetical protein VG325_00190 [Solirubrobacteraceae bacterium]|nr:hypothetical protein [Solirubrobacteraceae bacterium]